MSEKSIVFLFVFPYIIYIKRVFLFVIAPICYTLFRFQKISLSNPYKVFFFNHPASAYSSSKSKFVPAMLAATNSADSPLR